MSNTDMDFKRRRKSQFNGPEHHGQSHPEDDLLRPDNWFEDEEWKDLAQQVKRRAAEDVARNRFHAVKTDTGKQPDPEKVELNLKLQLPKFHLDSFKRFLTAVFSPVLIPARLFKKTGLKLKVAGAVAVVALSAGGFYYMNQPKKEDSQVQGAQAALQNADPSQEIVPSDDIQFDTVLPRGRDIPKDKIYYDAKRNFARYDDVVNAVAISVSQQPLPHAFKEDPDGNVKRIAADFAATEKMSLDGQNMYYGVSEKGPQTMILTKKDVLIFINTKQPVEKEALKLYAFNLD